MSDFHLVAFVILRRDDQILVARRARVRYADGMWALPGGHVEDGESLAAAAAREAAEEIGVGIRTEDLSPVGVCRYATGQTAGLDAFFIADRFTGEPRPVSECDEVTWCRPTQLPEPTVPWLEAALRTHLLEGSWFSEMLD